jgi:hypothetical protein
MGRLLLGLIKYCSSDWISVVGCGEEKTRGVKRPLPGALEYCLAGGPANSRDQERELGPPGPAARLLSSQGFLADDIVAQPLA